MKTEAETILIADEQLAGEILKMLCNKRTNSTFLKSVWKARGLTSDDFSRLQPQLEKESAAAIKLIIRRYSDARKADYQEIASLTEDLHFPKPFTTPPPKKDQ